MFKVGAVCHFIKDWKTKLYFALAVNRNCSFSKIIFFKCTLLFKFFCFVIIESLSDFPLHVRCLSFQIANYLALHNCILMRYGVFMCCLLTCVTNELLLEIELYFIWKQILVLSGFRYFLIWEGLTVFNLTQEWRLESRVHIWFRGDRSMLEMKEKI